MIFPNGLGAPTAPSPVDSLPVNFANYGKNAAAVILSRVQTLPTNKRKAALKRIMASIDSTLWKRTGQNVAAGMTDEEALALALGTGIATQLAQVGANHQASRGIAGINDGSMMQMVSAPSLWQPQPPQTDVAQFFQAPLTAMCPGYTWASATGNWERSRAHQGAPDQPGPAGAVCASGPTTPVHVTQETVVDGLPVTLPEQALITSVFAGLTATQKKTLKEMLEAASQRATYVGDMTQQMWPTWEGIKMDPNILAGKVMVKYVSRPAGHTLYFRGLSGGAFNLWLIPNRGVIDTLKAISEGTPIIGPLIKEIHEVTKGLACDLVSKQSTQQAVGNAAAAGPYGMAVAGGAALVASQCQQPQAPQVPQIPQGQSLVAEPFKLTPTMIVLGVLGLGTAAVLLTRKKPA